MSLHYLGKQEPVNCVFSVRHRHVSSPGECGWLWTEPVSYSKRSKWRPLTFPHHTATHIRLMWVESIVCNISVVFLGHSVLTNLTRKSNSTQDVDCCMPPPVQWWFQYMLFHRDLELWPFDPKIYCIHLCPIIHHWCTFGEYPSNTFQDIVLTIPESAVFDLWPFHPTLWSIHLWPRMHHWCKFGENTSSILQRYRINNVLGTDAWMDARTNGTKPLCLQPHYIGQRHKNRVNLQLFTSSRFPSQIPFPLSNCQH